MQMKLMLSINLGSTPASQAGRQPRSQPAPGSQAAIKKEEKLEGRQVGEAGRQA
jgi:hypothetical protein